jgi:hypothetical protein
MNSRLLALVLLCGSAITNVQADTLSCPDLSAAVQIGACPTEEELKYTFLGYCSDNARMYETDDTCSDYQRYRRMKNTALWEAGSGAFQAYLSCELPAATIKAARASKIAVSRQGGITRVICTYPDGIAFTHRAKGNCKVEVNGDCAANPDACRASCE